MVNVSVGWRGPFNDISEEYINSPVWGLRRYIQSGMVKYRQVAPKRRQELRSSILRGAVAFSSTSQRICNSFAKGESSPTGALPAHTVQMLTASPACTCSHASPPHERATSSKWGERYIQCIPPLYRRIRYGRLLAGCSDCHFFHLVLSSTRIRTH